MRSRPSSLGLVVAFAAPLLTGMGPLRAESWILPSSSFRPGSGGAEYRTDVRILNQGTAAVTVYATFFDQVTSAATVANPFRVEARSQAAFDNVLHSLFGREPDDGAYGPIQFEASGPILVAATVNNVNACGTGAVSGQWLPAVAASHALRAGVIGQVERRPPPRAIGQPPQASGPAPVRPHRLQALPFAVAAVSRPRAAPDHRLPDSPDPAAGAAGENPSPARA